MYMKKLISKIVLVVMSVLTVLCLASQVFASDLLIVDDGANNTSSSNTTLNSLTAQSLNSTSSTKNSTNMTASSILNNTNKSVYNAATTNSTLPKTGSDYTLTIVLFATVAFAIFAFVKIRNYKNI